MMEITKTSGIDNANPVYNPTHRLLGDIRYMTYQNIDMRVLCCWYGGMQVSWPTNVSHDNGKVTCQYCVAYMQKMGWI